MLTLPGAILTCLNLFATKIDQVIGLLEKRAAPPQPAMSHIIADTPGQIECFVWSASGSIITDALASSFPTVIAYVIDTPRTASPATFMANMLYACSILYKTKLPMILVFNKTDAHDASFAKEWMTDFEAFQAALRDNEENNTDGIGGSGYMASLLNSMSLVLDEFYKHLDIVPVSAITGLGIKEFFEAVDVKVQEYETEYKPEMERMRELREEQKMADKKGELEKLMKDMNVVGQSSGRAKPNEAKDYEDPAVLSDLESDDDDNQGWVDTDDAVPPRNGAPEDDNALKARYERALRDSGGTDGAVEGSALYQYLRTNS